MERFPAADLPEDAGALRPRLEALLEQLAGRLRIGLLQARRAERPLPRRRLEHRRAAEAQHRRARLLGDGMAVRRGIGHEDVGAGRAIVLLAVEDELRLAARDEVELLVPQLRALGMRLDDVDPRFLSRVRIRPERLDAERQPDRAPGQRPGPGNRLDVLEAHDLWRLGAQKTGVSV